MDTPIRILIVEDEPLYAQYLALAACNLGYEPLGPVDSAEAALHYYQQVPRPDLALLDINLAGNLDGVDLARELLATQPLPIIFMTARADTVTFARAKVLGPSAYLLKPFDERTLAHAVALALHNFAGIQASQAPPDDAPLALSTDLGLRHALFLRDRGRLVKVLPADIYYVEAGEKYCTVVTAAGKYAVRLSLRELAQELPVQQFVQTHRGYLVNADHIEQLDPAANTLTLAGTALPLGRAYREALLRQLRLLG
ncbi:MAG: response regulator transcription factor [Hymenobacter sp.]|nr:MAG: response regulator transcription factor [Hymenobacter sp.]